MLNQYFFHDLLNVYINQFGNLFNNIKILRLKDTGDEIERVKVPLLYGPKERYVMRYQQDPDLMSPIDIVYPRMSFEMTGITYARSRQQQRTLINARANTSSSLKTTYVATPYDLTFTLEVVARNTSQANQILEQIIPYFAPDFTVQVNLMGDLALVKDIPIILDSVNSRIEYEGGAENETKEVTVDFTFTMQSWFYGPVANSGLIRKVITNIYNDPSVVAGYILQANMTNGNNGEYKLDDMVYQGEAYNKAIAVGKVSRWNANTGKLYITGAQGTFKANTVVYAESSNAAYTLETFDVTPIKYSEITIVPDPLDALPNSNYGYTTTILEWPNT